MKLPLTIAALELRRFLRDRSNLFFVFVLPMLIVLFVGLQFGEGAQRTHAAVVGASSQLRSDLVDGLEDAGVEVAVAGREAALEQVARSRADIALFVDEGGAAAYTAGEDLDLTVVPSSQLNAQAAVQQVDTILRELSSRRGQLVALADAGVATADAERLLNRSRDLVQQPGLEVERVDELSEEFAGVGQFDFGASGQLLLFVFLSSLAGAATLIQARRLGVVARTLTAPVTARQLVLGETLGRFVIAMVQGAWIMVASSVLFDVGWGSLPVALLILSLFALVSAGAAMLLGAMMDNEGAASGLGVGLGLVLGALGGSMFPLELFPDGMRLVSRLTPHSWAYEAFAEVQRRGGGLLDVLPQLGVLGAMALLLLGAGAWAVRRSLARAL